MREEKFVNETKRERTPTLFQSNYIDSQTKPLYKRLDQVIS